jgi:hypothetical protein
MKLWYTFVKDMKLSLQGFYIYIELVMALIFVAVLMFVIPENFEPNVSVYAHIDLPDAMMSIVEKSLSREEFQLERLASRAEVEDALAKNRRAVGLEISREGGKYVYDYILQGYEDERFRNIIRESVTSHFTSALPAFEDVTEVETFESASEKLSDRLNMLPVYLALNAAFMGLFIIASYVFLDKEEGTIRALTVTPAKVWHYLAAKVGVLLVTGVVSALVVALLVAGSKPHYLHLMALVIACNFFGSALGLFIASFFNTMTKAMGWLYLAVIVLAFASISYYLPAFSPLAIRLLPSYPMLFAFRETLLDRANLGMIYANVGGFAAAGVVLFLLANYRFKRTLTV